MSLQENPEEETIIQKIKSLFENSWLLEATIEVKTFFTTKGLDVTKGNIKPIDTITIKRDLIKFNFIEYKYARSFKVN